MRPEGVSSRSERIKSGVLAPAGALLVKCISSGEVPEWSNGPDSKSGVRFSRTVGSNPTLSASNKKSPLQGAFFVTGRYVEFEPMGSTKRVSVLDARSAPRRGEDRLKAIRINPTPFVRKKDLKSDCAPWARQIIGT